MTIIDNLKDPVLWLTLIVAFSILVFAIVEVAYG